MLKTTHKFRLFLVNSLNSIFSSVFLKGVLTKITENTQKNRLKSMFCIVIKFIAIKLLFFVHSALIPGNKMQSSVNACFCLYLSSFHLSKFARHLVNHLLEAFFCCIFFFGYFNRNASMKEQMKKTPFVACVLQCAYFSLVILIDQLEIDFIFAFQNVHLHS